MESVTEQTGVGTTLIGELESIGQPVSFGQDECVMAEGEPGKGIYILRSGSARVSMTSHDGKTIELRELDPGSFIGLSSTLSCDHSCYTVAAAGAAEFTFVPSQEVPGILAFPSRSLSASDSAFGAGNVIALP